MMYFLLLKNSIGGACALGGLVGAVGGALVGYSHCYLTL